MTGVKPPLKWNETTIEMESDMFFPIFGFFKGSFLNNYIWFPTFKISNCGVCVQETVTIPYSMYPLSSFSPQYLLSFL